MTRISDKDMAEGMTGRSEAKDEVSQGISELCDLVAELRDENARLQAMVKWQSDISNVAKELDRCAGKRMEMAASNPEANESEQVTAAYIAWDLASALSKLHGLSPLSAARAIEKET